MNICLITGIFPPDIGGPATYVSRLAAALYAQEHRVCVVTLGDAAADTPFPVRRVSRRTPWALRLPLVCLLLLRAGWRSQVWYINGLELPSVLMGKLLQKRMIMKIVGDYAWERAMNRGATGDPIDAFQQQPQIRSVAWHKTLRAWLTRQAECVITPSAYLKGLVVGWGVSAERVRVIYNALEPLPAEPGARDDARRQFGFRDDERIVVTVGRLVAWKGVDRLIRAIAGLDESVRLVIVGDGPEKNKLTELAGALSVAHRIQFVGKAARRTTLAYLRAADLFVLNTGYEGFSHVLLEALQVGAPVITTTAGGNPELITHQENGLLIRPCPAAQDEAGNIAELRNQIERVLRDANLRQTLIEGGNRAIRRYTWDRLLDQTRDVLCGHEC
jgi:glycosyltransferase involved in cell wall biosynthesis